MLWVLNGHSICLIPVGWGHSWRIVRKVRIVRTFHGSGCRGGLGGRLHPICMWHANRFPNFLSFPPDSVLHPVFWNISCGFNLFHRQGFQLVRLATATRHSHSKVGTANAALRGQKTGTSTRVGPAVYYELSSDDDRPTGGERPAALHEPLPREKLLRHAGVGYEIVQSLDVLVPQMGEQLPNIVQFFAVQLPVVAEPVIEAVLEGLSASAAADQLVDVPTVVSYSSLQQLIAEQIDG